MKTFICSYSKKDCKRCKINDLFLRDLQCMAGTTKDTIIYGTHEDTYVNKSTLQSR